MLRGPLGSAVDCAVVAEEAFEARADLHELAVLIDGDILEAFVNSAGVNGFGTDLHTGPARYSA